jgi:hypothetical protein
MPLFHYGILRQKERLPSVQGALTTSETVNSHQRWQQPSPFDQLGSDAVFAARMRLATSPRDSGVASGCRGSSTGVGHVGPVHCWKQMRANTGSHQLVEELVHPWSYVSSVRSPTWPRYSPCADCVQLLQSFVLGWPDMSVFVHAAWLSVVAP